MTKLADLHSRVHRGNVSSAAFQESLHPESRWTATSLWASQPWRTRSFSRPSVTVLNQIYEEDFLGFSYGFRPGRSQHDALDALWVGIMRKKVNWVLDADIRGFFDTIDHEWLMQVSSSTGSPTEGFMRLIQKWLRAGVSEDGNWSKTEVGTPQGAVASPLLANIYLHYVFDLWVQHWRNVIGHGRHDRRPLRR